MMREPAQRVLSEHGYVSENNEWQRYGLHCTHHIDELLPPFYIKNKPKHPHPKCLIDGTSSLLVLNYLKYYNYLE